MSHYSDFSSSRKRRPSAEYAAHKTSWHILDTKSIWLKEFASSLNTLVRTDNWCPEIRNFGSFGQWQEVDRSIDPPLTTIRFPLQRGYGRFPISRVLRWEKTLVRKMLRRSRGSDPCPTLVCTSPFYAPVAEIWPGKVVYYLTDLTKYYAGLNPAQVVELDVRMCSVAQTVCPNSRRIADYLEQEAGCDPRKITVIPNATRIQSILSSPLTRAAELPAALAHLPRPVIGVIGNLASNLDWILLEGAVDLVRDVSWAFIGPTDMAMPDPVQRRARQILMERKGRVCFTGSKPYSELCKYARAFDVALIPYLKAEPTRSGSATRFYEHLAACRPILASRAHDELLTKEPLLKLIDTPADIASEIESLRSSNFEDGCEEIRWRVSRDETWLARAQTMLALTSVESELSSFKESLKPTLSLTRSGA